MPFFQNVFDQEFRGSTPFADRQYSLTFTVPANRNQSQAMISWNYDPYDFSAYNTFTINFAIDSQYFRNYATINVNVAGATPSATLAAEVVSILNADPLFPQWFTASLVPGNQQPGQNQPWPGPLNRVGIKAKLPKQAIRTYITNAGAEQALRFNLHAGVAELPTYYSRHTIANRFVFTDGLAALVQLDQNDAIVDQPIITAAGFTPSAMQADWQLFSGRVGLFTFQKLTVDGNGRIAQIIEYSAGAGPGDMARMINYIYSGANTNPNQITEIPYTLTTNDLVQPPPPPLVIAAASSTAHGIY